MSRPWLALLSILVVPARAAVVPQDSPCINIGDHTEAIPEFDPMTRLCRTAELEDAASFAAAWDKLFAKVRQAGTVRLPNGEYQRVLGRGEMFSHSLDEAKHWGDVNYVQYRDDPDGPVPLVAYLVTYRAMRVRDMLSATRMDFQAGADGRLHAVHVWHGVKLPGAPAMAWSQGPVMTVNQQSMLDGLWTLRFRQLVHSWTSY